MASVIVTGGAGFIGSHTCKALAAAGYLPVVVDTLEFGHAHAVKWGPLIKADIADRDAVGAAIATYRPEAVVHFAAYAYVGESVQDPARYYRNNVAGTLALLEACRDGGVSRTIFSSSCATYGVPEALPIVETASQNPVNPYGRTKLIAEQMLREFGAAYGSRFAALRYFNAAGADPDGELTERHDPETHLLPRALMAAAGTIAELDVFGTDYPTPDGTCIRDYVHVSDLAAAHVAALTDLLAGGGSFAANLGTGEGISVKQILKTIEAVTGRAVPARFGSRRAGDPPSLYADASFARKRLGFVPQWSAIETIVGTAAPGFGLGTGQ